MSDLLMGKGVAHVLAETYAQNPQQYATGHDHAFWNGRLLDYRSAPDGVRGFMIGAMRDGISAIREFYKIREPLYADVLNLVGWPGGMSMPVHADNCQIDGASNGLEHRAFSGNYYLTECDGGLLLPKQGLVILPRPGRFVSLPCGLSHPHGVQRATEGARITLTFFLTTDIDKADRGLL